MTQGPLVDVTNLTPVVQGGATVFDEVKHFSLRGFGANNDTDIPYRHTVTFQTQSSEVACSALVGEAPWYLGIQWNINRMSPNNCDQVCGFLKVDQATCNVEGVDVRSLLPRARPGALAGCCGVKTRLLPPLWTPMVTTSHRQANGNCYAVIDNISGAIVGDPRNTAEEALRCSCGTLGSGLGHCQNKCPLILTDADPNFMPGTPIVQPSPPPPKCDGLCRVTPTGGPTTGCGGTTAEAASCMCP
uniref:Uncharacterized protein n=1 Tax=Chromera velia CCMP2878 TaxID=1169474 RepID=A0A0G4HR14_9ALVE|eukprot:Cvel_30408.t1-p1 / transcript=Cvel_30408.t1 / gene=Cvel_30408 / organism=Chromera_velia_CCMP2878 / gene_product=hypothetical protein / transcript_product=hypothetical protein / location=Cvel_scaffold4330:1591-2322(+) / protein_length=244 / sequence_SO=supercontig / SO=protein_coding / is_pseudo=false